MKPSTADTPKLRGFGAVFAIAFVIAVLAAVFFYVQVTEEGGTAYMSSLDRWKLYGKTGTAQNSGGKDHGWFAGFAGPPGRAPEIVVVAIVEHGLHGSDVAPIAAKAAAYYLDRKHGLPIDRRPTLAERLRSRKS